MDADYIKFISLNCNNFSTDVIEFFFLLIMSRHANIKKTILLKKKKKKQSSYDLHVFSSKKKIMLSHYMSQIIQPFIFIWNIFNISKSERDTINQMIKLHIKIYVY